MGNNVRFSGINVGTVDKIIIVNDSTVQVDMLIKSSVQDFIKSNSEVSISSEGIIGDKLLVISQGSTNARVVRDGEELVSNEPVEFDEIIEGIEATALNAEIISEELAEILSSLNSGKGTLGRLLKDTTIAEDLGRTMRNLKSSTKGLDENMEAAKSNFLLRGYFKRQERDERKRKKAEEKERKENEKKNE